MTERVDVIVVGAGHNGLTCAAYLARAGLRTLILEAGNGVGGMAAPVEFGAGYRSPGLAHVAYPIAADIRRDLELDRHGYAPGEGIDTIALAADGRHLVIGDAAASGDGLPAADRDAYPAFRRRYLSFVEALAPLIDNAPPRLKNMPFADRKTLARLAWKLRIGLGREAMYEFLRVVAINIYDVLNETFGDERLKGALAAEAVMGSSMGPRTPGTVLTWLQWLTGRRNGPMVLVGDDAANPVHALARAAEGAGAELRCAAEVKRILVEDDRAAGVELADGERIEASCVVSGADPRRTFLELVGAPRLDAMFANRVGQIRCAGTVGKLLLGLGARPAFTGLDEALHGGRLLIAPTLRGVERAFNPSKYGEYPQYPVLDITLPSLANGSLAPDGHHVMSVNVAFVPHAPKDDSAEARAAFAARLIGILDDYAPGLASQVTASEFLAPAEIEARCRATGGHWHHGELAIHQSFMMRPLYGAAQYETPVDGLYLCSAGCHPGGGLSGLPGRNAAKRVLESGGGR